MTAVANPHASVLGHCGSRRLATTGVHLPVLDARLGVDLCDLVLVGHGDVDVVVVPLHLAERDGSGVVRVLLDAVTVRPHRGVTVCGHVPRLAEARLRWTRPARVRHALVDHAVAVVVDAVANLGTGEHLVFALTPLAKLLAIARLRAGLAPRYALCPWRSPVADLRRP